MDGVSVNTGSKVGLLTQMKNDHGPWMIDYSQPSTMAHSSALCQPWDWVSSKICIWSCRIYTCGQPLPEYLLLIKNSGAINSNVQEAAKMLLS